MRNKKCNFVVLLLILLCSLTSLGGYYNINNICKAENVGNSMLLFDVTLLPIKEQDSFTPINTETGKRYGEENLNKKSFIPERNKMKTIDGTDVYYFERVIDLSSYSFDGILSKYEETALEFWTYIDSASGRNFGIRLEFDTNETLTFEINYLDLCLKLLDDENDGDGWVKISIPFSKGVVEDKTKIYDETNEKFEKLVNITFYQSVEDVSKIENDMLFYDVMLITQKTQNNMQIIEKQAKFCYNFDFLSFYSNMKQENYTGDTWNIPDLLGQEKCYFWYGRENLLATVKIVVDSNTSNAKELNSTYTFDKTGSVSFVVCGKTAEDKYLFISESRRTAMVYEFVGMNIPVKKIKLTVGDTYELKYEINNSLSDMKNLQILPSSDILKVVEVNQEDGIIKFEATDSGTCDVNIIFTATRNGKETEYKTSFEMNISKDFKLRNTILTIFTVSAFGVVLAVALISGIKKIKNANK